MKKIVITGGNKGIGLETTKMLLAQNHKVYVVARNTDLLHSITDSNCIKIKYDLNNLQGIKQLVQEIGVVDVLINNSGIMNTFTYDNYPTNKKDELMRINLEAPIELISQMAPLMIANGGGRIVNNASIAGHIGHPDIWYGISKAGLINATKSFAKLLGGQGIIVNAVAPGPVETEMLNIIPEQRKAHVLSTVVTGRFAYAEEIAKTICWLALDSPEYINGTIIDVNNCTYLR